MIIAFSYKKSQVKVPIQKKGGTMISPKALFYLIKRSFFGVHYPLGISFDITSRCNLHCKHCYFLTQNQKGELSDEQMLSLVQRLQKEYPYVMHAGWVGGEPLLRKELLTECAKLFPLNMIVTNGTIELPYIANGVFNVSVDGTKEYYERIRGTGIYDKVKEHADRKDIRVNVTCVLNSLNKECIEDLLEEWKSTQIQGISFSFYTPQKGARDPLHLNDNQKDLLIDKLIELKKEYNEFILNSRSVLKLMKSKEACGITLRCVAPKALLSIDANGIVKYPCVMGSNVDCSRCGCVVPFEIESVVRRRHFDSMRMVKKFYVGK